MNIVRVPIFPLPVFLLPEGRVRLRIFEARYLRMVSIASESNGFVIQYLTKSEQQSRWGSAVVIEDFNQGKDGVLEIDVYCHTLVNMCNCSQDEDGLQFADIEAFEHWSQHSQVADSSHNTLVSALKNIIANTALLNSLYQEKPLENATWVISRWLELLPVNSQIKHAFVNEYNFAEAKVFVESIIGQQSSPNNEKLSG